MSTLNIDEQNKFVSKSIRNEEISSDKQKNEIPKFSFFFNCREEENVCVDWTMNISDLNERHLSIEMIRPEERNVQFKRIFLFDRFECRKISMKTRLWPMQDEKFVQRTFFFHLSSKIRSKKNFS